MANDLNNRNGKPSRKALLMVAINVAATAILFFLTVHDDEPLIAPMFELSMVLRWMVIAAVVAFLQFMWDRGRKSGG